jgi:hypothetical protein
MPEGPLGGPRPLATGSVVLLMTTESSILQSAALERNLNDVGENVNVELDGSVNTYMISTELDAVDLSELNELADIASDLYTGKVEGFSVGFQ